MATYISQGKTCLKLAHLVLKSNLPLMTVALLGSNQLRPPSVLHSTVRPGNATFVTSTPLTILKKQTTVQGLEINCVVVYLPWFPEGVFSNTGFATENPSGTQVLVY